jgi:hypothetical protein
MNRFDRCMPLQTILKRVMILGRLALRKRSVCMKLWRALLIAGFAAFLVSSCCVTEWFDDDDDVIPSAHSEGGGGDT